MEGKEYDDDEHYFTEKHQKAIVEYIEADEDAEEKKQWLFEEYIGPAFEELIENIVNTYKFTDLENLEKKKEECKTWLVTVIDKYDPEKSKAFSYFTVVIRNWFTQQLKKHSKRKKRETGYDEIPKYIEKDYLTTHNPIAENIEKKEFFEHLVEEIERWVESERVRRILGDNDLKVANAILELFNRTEDIDIFSKKAIYFYIRKMTDLNTKQVSRSLKKLEEKYEIFKRQWREDRIG